MTTVPKGVAGSSRDWAVSSWAERKDVPEGTQGRATAAPGLAGDGPLPLPSAASSGVSRGLTVSQGESPHATEMGTGCIPRLFLFVRCPSGELVQGSRQRPRTHPVTCPTSPGLL